MYDMKERKKERKTERKNEWNMPYMPKQAKQAFFFMTE